MKILIADSFPSSHIEQLTALGHLCHLDAALDGDALVAAVPGYEVLIVRSTKVNAGVIDAGDALKLIVRAGAGTNTIDKAYAASKDVRVCNVPGANALAVAELAMGLILCIDRRLVDNAVDLKNQRWNKQKYSQARGLYGQTLGILGAGAIGLAVAARAAAFGLKVLVVKKPTRAAATQQRLTALGIEEVDSQQALLQQSDIVSLHLPYSEATHLMVDKAFLAQMRDAAVLINTSRGELVDEAALLEAMEQRGLRAGLDVYQNEPAAGQPHFDSALARHPNVCGTHHIGASTAQAQTAVADGVLQVLKSYQDGALKFCVNQA